MPVRMIADIVGKHCCGQYFFSFFLLLIALLSLFDHLLAKTPRFVQH